MRKHISVVLIFILIITFFSACKQKPVTNSKPVVFVSILPQQYFVQRIAGDRYQIEVMIPPGMGHSDYDPTPQQMKELANAKLFFRIGYIVFEDAWMKTIAANNPGLGIINTSTGTNLLQEEESVFETHDSGAAHKHNDSGIDPRISGYRPKKQKFRQNIIWMLLSNWTHPDQHILLKTILLLLTISINSIQH